MGEIYTAEKLEQEVPAEKDELCWLNEEVGNWEQRGPKKHVQRPEAGAIVG